MMAHSIMQYDAIVKAPGFEGKVDPN